MGIMNEMDEFLEVTNDLRELMGKPPLVRPKLNKTIPYDEDPAYAEERRLNGYVAQCDTKLCEPPDTRNVNDEDFFPDLPSNTGY